MAKQEPTLSRLYSSSSAQKPWPRGSLAVTKDEYNAAKRQSVGVDSMSDCAYQVVRYCLGMIFDRDAADTWLQSYRGSKRGA